MPIFEYKCKKCGEQFEFLVRAGKKPLCPKCGSGSLKKLISSFSSGISAKSSGAGPGICARQLGGRCCGGEGPCGGGGHCCL